MPVFAAGLLVFGATVALLLAAGANLHRRIARQTTADAAALGAASVQAFAFNVNAAANWGILALHAAEATALLVGGASGAAMIASGNFTAEGIDLLAESRDIAAELLAANQQLADARDTLNRAVVPGLALGMAVMSGVQSELAVVPYPLGPDEFADTPGTLSCREALRGDGGAGAVPQRDPRRAGWNLQVDRVEAQGVAAGVYRMVRAMLGGAATEIPPPGHAVDGAIERAVAAATATGGLAHGDLEALAQAAFSHGEAPAAVVAGLAQRWRSVLSEFRGAYGQAAGLVAIERVGNGQVQSLDELLPIAPPGVIVDEAVSIVTATVVGLLADRAADGVWQHAELTTGQWQQQLLPAIVGAMRASLQVTLGSVQDLVAIAKGGGGTMSQRRGTSLLDSVIREAICGIDAGATAWLGEQRFPLPTLVPANYGVRQRFTVLAMARTGADLLPAFAVAESQPRLPKGLQFGEPILVFGFTPALQPLSAHRRLLGNGPLADMIDAFVQL